MLKVLNYIKALITAEKYTVHRNLLICYNSSLEINKSWIKTQKILDGVKDDAIHRKYCTKHKQHTLYLDSFGSNNIGQILLGHLRTFACR